MSRVKIDPMRLYIASMGKIFRVTHVCLTNDEANEVCRKHPDIGVMGEDPSGFIYLAEIYGSVCPTAILNNMKEKA